MSTQETILIADDAEINRMILRSLFKGEYNLLEAENGEQALMLLQQYKESITAVLLDLVMPEKNGYQVLESMQAGELLYHIPVIVITADDSTDSKVRVFELGASDIITKPFEPNVVKSRVKNIIELGRYRQRLEALVAEQSARAQKSNAAIIDMLSSVIEHRSLESGQHIRRIRMFTQILLEEVAKNYQEYGLDARKIQLITDASSMHDIGKIAIPDSILNKPGRLTPEEFEVMKTHTTKGCEILKELDQLQDREYLQYAYNICRYHHERWDGKGYPDGLKENSIPICAQVVAIADCYDALTTDRVYKKAIPQNRAFSMILNGECGVFSPRLLECFKHVRDPFADLSQEYADGRTVDQPLATQLSPNPPVWELGETTLEQSQLKYFALLRYMDATVMEADLNTGVFHLVYLADQDFAMLRSRNSFEESIRTFANTAVHPEDRAEALKLLGSYVQEFFDEGLTRRDQRYRVFDRKHDDYIWCRACLLRINLENPRSRKFLVIWHKEGEEAPVLRQHLGTGGQNFPILEKLLSGLQKCRNDRYFTMLQINRGLVDLLGYTEQELAQQFQNRFTALMYPPDRDRVAAEFQRQSNAGKVMELEYRLVTKDGRIIWVSDRCLLAREGDEDVVYCILLDITRSRQAEEDLRLSLERHQIIMNQSNDIIFEWNIITDELYLSSNWEKQFGYTPIVRQVRTTISNASHLNPDDVPAFVHLMDVMAAGATYKETELRIADAEGQYRWARIRATSQFDVDGKPLKVVGVILDIDAQKKAAAALEERATRDGLTKLYNRAFAQERIQSRLANSPSKELSVLMVLDVDNFKQINDRFGHMFGDAVLVELSGKIAGMFRAEDTISRIGGDEFMVFMPSVRDQATAERRAQEMLHNLQELFRETLGDTLFSCSIGLAFSPGGRVSFQELFNQADRALYRAKAQGKNRFICYDEEMETGPIGLPVPLGRVARTQIDSNHSERRNLPLLITKVFDILYNSPKLEEGIQSILALIGERFEVSRAYIIESNESGNLFFNTFEWCAEGVSSQKSSLQEIPYLDQGNDYRDHFDANGIFYCQDIQHLPQWQQRLLERQGVLSVLQYAIRENGQFYGMVGFDDCAVRRLWTDEQAEALTFVGKLLAVFLRKQRTQEALTTSLANLRSVLDHQEVWLYVLAPDSYAIRYANQKTKELVPDAQVGRRCYEVFYHRDAPCPDCVLNQARKQGQSTQEYFNSHLNMWVLADAAMVNWDKEDACMVACRNISPYKEASDGLVSSHSSPGQET